MRSNLHISRKIICRNTFKSYFLLFLSINLLAAFTTNLRSDVEQIYKKANGRLSREGASCLDKYYIASTRPCPRVSEVGGWQWRCTYKDGYAVNNCFRKCRGTIEVAKYFLGLANGDCDSYALINGSRSKVCFSNEDAQRYHQKHGPIIAIRLVKECWE